MRGTRPPGSKNERKNERKAAAGQRGATLRASPGITFGVGGGLLDGYFPLWPEAAMLPP
jgi:hypothetical protein